MSTDKESAAAPESTVTDGAKSANAVTSAAANVAGEAVSGSTSDVAKQVAPPLNTRIEVLWTLTSEAGVAEERWWGARVQDVERENGEERHVLLYDAYGDFGEVVVRVKFQTTDTLLDLSRSTDNTLYWRLEGSTTSDVLTVQDVVHDGDVLAMMMDALTSLPADKQLRYASAYRTFADRIKDALDRLLQDKGEDYVITAADVHAIFAQLR